MGGVLSPDRILRQLADLWTSSAHTENAAAGDGVLRACSMTLIVFAEQSDDLPALGETIAALMPEHPARVILVLLSGAGERALSDRVYQQCWKPFGQQHQICCEQVEITASDAALGDLPAVLLPLIAADVPVILWCRSPRLLEVPEFTAIAGMAGKLIVNSAGAPDAAAILARIARASRSGIVADLAWTCITRWREMLAQVFGNRERLAHIGSIARVSVEFGPTFETAAWYMAAWIADALRSAGGHPQTSVSSSPDVRTIRLALEGEGLRVAMVRHGETLIATVNELSHCTNLAPPGDYLFMREELGIVRRDPTYDRALAGARAFIGR